MAKTSRLNTALLAVLVTMAELIVIFCNDITSFQKAIIILCTYGMVCAMTSFSNEDGFTEEHPE